jgi:hypothetical protein
MDWWVLPPENDEDARWDSAVDTVLSSAMRRSRCYSIPRKIANNCTGREPLAERPAHWSARSQFLKPCARGLDCRQLSGRKNCWLSISRVSDRDRVFLLGSKRVARAVVTAADAAGLTMSPPTQCLVELATVAAMTRRARVQMGCSELNGIPMADPRQMMARRRKCSDGGNRIVGSGIVG